MPAHTPSPGDHSDEDSSVFCAVYSNVPVYETIKHNVVVMRRIEDDQLNATQILKLAGLAKSQRTKVLESQVHSGEHEKVQGGYGKYQGTWVPFETGRNLAIQFKVYDLIEPLLTFTSGTDPLYKRASYSKIDSNFLEFEPRRRGRPPFATPLYSKTVTPPKSHVSSHNETRSSSARKSWGAPRSTATSLRASTHNSLSVNIDSHWEGDLSMDASNSEQQPAPPKHSTGQKSRKYAADLSNTSSMSSPEDIFGGESSDNSIGSTVVSSYSNHDSPDQLSASDDPDTELYESKRKGNPKRPSRRTSKTTSRTISPVHSEAALDLSKSVDIENVSCPTKSKSKYRGRPNGSGSTKKSKESHYRSQKSTLSYYENAPPEIMVMPETPVTENISILENPTLPSKESVSSMHQCLSDLEDITAVPSHASPAAPLSLTLDNPPLHRLLFDEGDFSAPQTAPFVDSIELGEDSAKRSPSTFIPAPISKSAQVATPAERCREIILGIYVYGDDYVYETFQYLRDQNSQTGYDFNLVLDNQGCRAIHWAAACARVKMLRMLIYRGANTCLRSNGGETPLMRAVGSHNNYTLETFPDILGLLMPSLFSTDISGRTVLHYICFVGGHRSKRAQAKYYMHYVLKYMSYAQPCLNITTDLKMENHTETNSVAAMIEEFVNAQDSFGQTALHVAVRFRNHRLIQMLLRAGARRDICDKNGDTPLGIAGSSLRTILLLNRSVERLLVPELYDIDDFSDAATSIASVESDDDISTAKDGMASKNTGPFASVRNSFSCVLSQKALDAITRHDAAPTTNRLASSRYEVTAILKRQSQLDGLVKVAQDVGRKCSAVMYARRSTDIPLGIDALNSIKTTAICQDGVPSDPASTLLFFHQVACTHMQPAISTEQSSNKRGLNADDPTEHDAKRICVLPNNPMYTLVEGIESTSFEFTKPYQPCLMGDEKQANPDQSSSTYQPLLSSQLETVEHLQNQVAVLQMQSEILQTNNNALIQAVHKLHEQRHLKSSRYKTLIAWCMGVTTHTVDTAMQHLSSK
ncbi:transcription factor [Batrachochytrium dendrobatidis]